jgi:hypothetical protein
MWLLKAKQMRSPAGSSHLDTRCTSRCPDESTVFRPKVKGRNFENLTFEIQGREMFFTC